MPSKVTMRDLLESGVHFGHRSRKWNPKMDDFIYMERNGVHIIDLQQTMTLLHDIHDKIRDEVQRGGSVLFVGTKRQAQETIEQEADRCHMPYVNQRWLGGTLTNWKTIRQRIEALHQLEQEQQDGIFERLTKKERLMKQREIDRLKIRLGGIQNMEKLPTLLFVVDVVREQTAVKEANKMRIPIVAVVDTNGDPDLIDHIVPANDDAIRAIRLLTKAVADAVIEGQNMRKDGGDAEPEVKFAQSVEDEFAYMDDDDDEAYLGQSTLAKLREGDLRFQEQDDDGDDDTDVEPATTEESEETTDE